MEHVGKKPGLLELCTNYGGFKQATEDGES